MRYMRLLKEGGKISKTLLSMKFQLMAVGHLGIKIQAKNAKMRRKERGIDKTSLRSKIRIIITVRRKNRGQKSLGLLKNQENLTMKSKHGKLIATQRQKMH